MVKKLKAAVSDTDILIHLATGNRLDTIGMLFEEIIIPWYIYDHELKKKAGAYLSMIQTYINSQGSVCRVINREQDAALNVAAIPTINDKKIFCGKGESECAGYAYALKIPIIVSDNKNDFRHFQEYIMLRYTDLLALCIHHGLFRYEEAKEIFFNINNKLEYPTGMSFDRILKDSDLRFKTNGWTSILGINSPVDDVEVAADELKVQQK